MIAKKKLKFHFRHNQAGTQDVVFHPSGEYVVSCGADGNMRVTNMKDPNNVDAAVVEHNNPVNSVAVSKFGDKLICGTEDHEVRVFSLPSMEFQSILSRFTLPVHHVAFNPSGSIAAAGGDDGTLKLVVVDTAQGVASINKAHDGSPILSLAFDPKGKYLASAGGDGTVVIWDVSSGVTKLTTIQIAKVDPTIPYQRLRLSWDTNGNFLAIPGDTDVSIVERDTWKQVSLLKERHSSPVSLTAWSPSGRYLATCDLESKVNVWDMNTKEDLESYKHTKTITGISWSPVGNTLVVIDVVGHMGVWDHVIPPNFPHPASGTQQEQKKVEAVAAMLESERQEAEEEAAASDNDSEPEGGRSRRRLKKRIVDDEDDFAVPDDDVEMNDTTEEKKSKEKTAKDKKYGEIKAVPPPVHPPIQPGATPDGLKRRFLAYNLIGSIVTRDEGDFSAVEIEFADAAFHNKITINDNYNFTLGALGESGAVFACRSSISKDKGDDKFVHSAISFRPFNSWATKADWVLNLSPTEDAVCVGISKSHVLVATTQNYLRVFTLGGVQRAILCVPGAPVAIAAEGDWAAIVYNAYPGLALLVLNLKDGSTRYDSGLPLSPNATLTWIGFAGETVCTADSSGILRALSHVWMGSKAPPRWVPLVDFTVQRLVQGDSHWVVGVTEKQVMCVICKGDKFPQVLPRPVLSVVELSVPIIERGETTVQEEAYIRESLFLNSRIRSAIDRGEVDSEELDKQTGAVEANLIRLIVTACKKDQQPRALDLTSLLTLRKSIVIAQKLAHQERRTVLSSKMNELLESFENCSSKAEEEMNTQYFRDQMVQATAETVTQLQDQYSALLAAHAELALKQESHTTANGSSKPAKAEPAKKTGSKLSAIANSKSNGHSNGHQDEAESDDDAKEEAPAKYESPYESEEEEEEKEESKPAKQEEKEDKEEEKEEPQEEEEKEEKDEEKEEAKDEDEAKDEEETPKPKAKKAAAKKGAKKAKKDDEEKDSKAEKKKTTTRGKKQTEAKKTKSPSKDAVVDPVKPRNPFAVKKPTTVPKGQPTGDEKEKEEKEEEKSNSKEDRKRKTLNGKTSPPAKTKQPNK